MQYTKEKMKVYIKEYRQKRILEAQVFLGGECAQCGTKDELEFDHINIEDKKYNISKILTSSKEVFWDEIKKCQLLCRKCHKIKTKKDANYNPWNKGKWNHGTTTGYRKYKCRCSICVTSQRNRRKNLTK